MAETPNLDITLLEEDQASKFATVNSAIVALENAITERVEADVTSGNVTLTDVQLEAAILVEITNATTAGRVVTLPAVRKLIIVTSSASNTESVTFQVGTTQATLNPGRGSIAFLDGTADGMLTISSGASEFISLDDVTETTFTGSGNHILFVNSGATGVEFRAPTFEISGQIGTVASGTVVFEKLMAQSSLLPSGLSGSQGYAKVAPSGGSASFEIQKNGSSAGTVNFADGSNTATFSFTSDTAFIAGDRVAIVATATLNSVADVTFTLLGTRT